MDDGYIDASTVPLALYAFAAFFAVSASWLLFRFVIRHNDRASKGLNADLLGLSEALTATALALGLAGVAFLISHVL